MERYSFFETRTLSKHTVHGILATPKKNYKPCHVSLSVNYGNYLKDCGERGVFVTMSERTIANNDEAISVELTETDIPGAFLSEPFDHHTIPEFRWWLLCRGIQAPTSWKKQRLMSR